MRTRIVLLLTLAIAAGTGCTVRYSQALVGTLPQETGSQVRSSATGFELLSIALTEPTPAHEQVQSLMGACKKLTRVEVDYRQLFFILFGIPRITVTGQCVS